MKSPGPTDWPTETQQEKSGDSRLWLSEHAAKTTETWRTKFFVCNQILTAFAAWPVAAECGIVIRVDEPAPLPCLRPPAQTRKSSRCAPLSRCPVCGCRCVFSQRLFGVFTWNTCFEAEPDCESRPNLPTRRGSLNNEVGKAAPVPSSWTCFQATISVLSTSVTKDDCLIPTRSATLAPVWC